MKKTVLLMMAIAAISQSVWGYEAKGSFAEAKVKAAELGKPLLVDFYADW